MWYSKAYCERIDMSDHRYRFGKNGDYLKWNYQKPRGKRSEKRYFPKDGLMYDTIAYVREYFRLNSHLGFHS